MPELGLGDYIFLRKTDVRSATGVYVYVNRRSTTAFRAACSYITAFKRVRLRS